MFSALLERASENPKLRRPFMLLLRRAWRLRRATLATAVLVVCNERGYVLIMSDRESPRLPFVELHAWDPIPAQVEASLKGLGETRSLALVAVDGTPSSDGMTFLYGAKLDQVKPNENHSWLGADIALGCLNENDRRLLCLYFESQNNARSAASISS